MKKHFKYLLCLVLLFCFIISFSACGGNKDAEDTTAESTEAEVTDNENKESTEASTEAETEPIVEVDDNKPEFVNPLTGMPSETDLSTKRPVSIMVNNIEASLPQSGIYNADILFECLAEGGITRLMMISTEYEDLPKVGSVRSARDYYIDWAESFNCIFIHAGGSDQAYSTLASRGTNRLDGVNGPCPGNLFYRDQERRNNGYASEHTLFITDGTEIAKAISSMGYSTTKAAGYETPMVFREWGADTVKGTANATHVGVDVSSYQHVDYVYDEKSEQYLRYQYDGQPHMDYTANKQLAFKNVLILYNESGIIFGDEKNRLWMTTTGESTGYYITAGTYREIIWKKSSHDSVIKYFYKDDGTEVQFNRGKTMINIVNNSYKSKTVFDDNTEQFESKE